MRRRHFLGALGIATLGTRTTDEWVGQTRAATTVGSLEFDSSASLLDSSGNYLTDSSKVAVTAEDTATNEDSDGNGDATYYDSTTSIPLVAVDGDVVGLGATLVSDQANFRSGNEEFLLNVWDAHLGGSGTVLFDEGHDQYHTLTDFSNMANYAAEAGYTVTATSTLASDLSGADAAWLTGPATAFTSSEKQALADFVAGGGVLFVHDRADYSNQDETANLNDIARSLSLAFRFNDDQVTDDTNNGGVYYKPTTTQFNTAFNYFADRPGMEIDPDASHDVEVIDVADGDTVDIRFDSGREETIRVLGVDTPEKEQYQRFERIVEWEGLESLEYLATWGQNATDYATQELSNTRITLSFDDAEPGIFDAYDRLLGYIHYDRSGSGTRDTFYNRDLVEKGYARLYASSFSNHAGFADAEATARNDGLKVWADADPDNSTEYRNRDADDLFFPKASTVRTSAGAIDRSRVPITAADSATQTSVSGTSYSSDLPLVGVDETQSVAVVGGLLIDESYEQAEDFAVDTSTYENFVVLTNLIEYLSTLSGDVLVDGGHGQFGADYALAAEDMAYYQRHLEGFDIGLEQVNELTADSLASGQALLVSTPPEAFISAEQDAVNGFLADGGAVILLGGNTTTNDARANLNDLAAGMGTDLRLNDDTVEDTTNNLNSDATLPVTSRFDTAFPLFTARGSTSGSGEFTIGQISESGDTLNEEYVVFENTGDAALDLTGWRIEDAAAHGYQFPDGFSLDAGATVTLHTGSGTDSATDLYWGSGTYIWNNSGDTVYGFDDTGSQVLAYTY